VPRCVESDNFELASVELGKLESALNGHTRHAQTHLNGGLVRLAAGRQEHRLVESGREAVGQGFRQVDDRPAEEVGEEMVQVLVRVGDNGGDFGVSMPKDGAHLSAGEVKDAPAVRVVNVGALGSFDQVRQERASVVDHLGLGQLPEGGVGFRMAFHTA
jgi:hypothetical protein